MTLMTYAANSNAPAFPPLPIEADDPRIAPEAPRHVAAREEIGRASCRERV